MSRHAIKAFRPEDHTFAICAYKENPYLAETIEAIKSQTVLGDIIVSTSTPNDHIISTCKEYHLPLYINPDPHLPGNDWNFAYDRAKTPLVTIAHQDDIYRADYLETMLRLLNNYGNDVLMAFSDYYEIREEGIVDDNSLLKIKRVLNAPFSYRNLNGSRFVKRRMLAFGDAICCPAVVIVKDTAGESIFDLTYRNSCDYKTWVDLASMKGRFLYSPEKLVGHRIYAESATTRNLSEGIRKREDLEIFSTLWPRPAAKAVNWLYAISEKSNQ